MTPLFTGVVAMDDCRGIGLNGGIPWHLPADLRHFKNITMGHPILMGRKTFESLKHPLPGRQNIVLTRNPGYQAEGAVVIHDIAELDSLELQNHEVMVIGGAQVYELLLPKMSRLHVSHVPGAHNADTFFPAFEHLFSSRSTPILLEGFSACTFFRISL